MNSTSTNSTTSTASKADYLGTYISIITLNSVGTLVFFVLLIVMTILLIYKWKNMVLNKRLMYILILFSCFNQQIYQLCGLIGYSSAMGMGPLGLTGTFLGFEFAGYLLSLTLWLDCQAVITKVLYGVYFNNNQAWMRNSKAHSICKKVVLISTIIIVAFFNLLLILTLPYAFISSLLTFIDPTRKILSLAQVLFLQQFTKIFHPLIGSVISAAVCYLSILNFGMAILLIRKLLDKQHSNIVTPQKRKACRNLIILNFGQVLMSLMNTFAVITAGVATAIMPLYVISIFVHRCSIFIFCIVVNISFGPLDNVSKIGHQAAEHHNQNEERDEKAKVSDKVVTKSIVTTLEPTNTETIENEPELVINSLSVV